MGRWCDADTGGFETRPYTQFVPRHRLLAGCVKTPSERGNGPRNVIPVFLSVIPAKAGIQGSWAP